MDLICTWRHTHLFLVLSARKFMPEIPYLIRLRLLATNCVVASKCIELFAGFLYFLAWVTGPRTSVAWILNMFKNAQHVFSKNSHSVVAGVSYPSASLLNLIFVSQKVRKQWDNNTGCVFFLITQNCFTTSVRLLQVPKNRNLFHTNSDIHAPGASAKNSQFI